MKAYGGGGMVPLILDLSSPGKYMPTVPRVSLQDQLVRHYLPEAVIRDGVHGGTVIQDDLWWLPQDLMGTENGCV